jgi:hypothetical protein
MLGVILVFISPIIITSHDEEVRVTATATVIWV